VPIQTLFTVQQEDLARLDAREAVRLFRELLWAEARTIGLPTSNVRVSELIDVADGGIDAVVEGTLPESTDLIQEGRTGYQIKAGSAFKPWQKSMINEELFGRRRGPSRENLSSSIRDCLDEDGTYILVCSKQDPVDNDYRQAIDHLRFFLEECKYPNPKVDVWGQSTLIGFLRRFPSLALRVTGRDQTVFQSHRSWSLNGDMRKAFRPGQHQHEVIAALREELRRNDRTIHVRVVGDPGIGKTKLVLEATRTEDLQPLVVYCDKPQMLVGSELLNQILREDNDFSVILVVDECDPTSAYYIWDLLQSRGPRIKLISIYSEALPGSAVDYFEVKPLEGEQILSIFEEYDLPRDQADRWVDMCDGSPRVAHLIGLDLRNDPQAVLSTPNAAVFWDRYIRGGTSDSARVEQRRLVLHHLALFKRFGYKPPVDEEARVIHRMIQQADQDITWYKFQEIIEELRGRKILQGSTTLYITPKALHVKLWIDWWEIHGYGFSLEEFYGELTETLHRWFNEMFQYAASSPAASQVVQRLLGEGGPFQNSEMLRTELGASFFLALTEADPRSALRTLERTIGTWSRQQFLEFTTGRREVVWALEKIAVWKDLFANAARLLLALGEAENERYSNNASGVFAGLFSPGPGQVAPTEASPDERLPVLVEALNSNTKERRLLALSACDQALESRHFSRIGRLELKGLQPSAKLWTPETYSELFDAYRRVWQLLRDRLDRFPKDEQPRAVDVLLDHASGLGSIPNLSDMVVDTLSEMAQKPYVDDRKVLEKAIEVLHYEGNKLSPQVRDRWEHLRDELTGEGFQAMMRRYVSMDLLEDKFDEQRQRVDQAQPKIEELAQQAVADLDLLKPELRWLVRPEARNGFRFAYELGKRDPGLELLPMLLEAQKSAGTTATGYFLGGYFRVLFEENQSEWEEQLDTLAADEQLRMWIPELTWRSGMTDRAAMRVLKLYEEGAVDIGSSKMFALGGVVRHLSEDVFVRFVEFLLASPADFAASVALDLIRFYYFDEGSERVLPKNLTIRVLTHRTFLQKRGRGQRDQMDEYTWTEVATSFVRLYPGESLDLADFILRHFGEDGTIFESFFSQTQNVLTEIVRLHPEQVWKRITEYLGPPIDSRAFGIRQWLRGRDLFEPEDDTAEKDVGVLDLIPPAAIWRWVDEDVEQRGWYVANLVPPRLFREEGRVCLAREVLVRYGDRDDVRRNLRGNFSTEGWTGHRSLHLDKKKGELLKFKAAETNQNVRRWIDEYVDLLDADIESARIEEEREYP